MHRSTTKHMTEPATTKATANKIRAESDVDTMQQKSGRAKTTAAASNASSLDGANIASDTGTSMPGYTSASQRSARSAQPCNLRVQVRAGVEQSPSSADEPTPRVFAVQNLGRFIDAAGRTCLDLRIVLDQTVAMPMENHRESQLVDHTSSADMPRSRARRSRVCKHWAQGCCIYGSACKFLHPEQISSTDASAKISSASSAFQQPKLFVHQQRKQQSSFFARTIS